MGKPGVVTPALYVLSPTYNGFFGPILPLRRQLWVQRQGTGTWQSPKTLRLTKWPRCCGRESDPRRKQEVRGGGKGVWQGGAGLLVHDQRKQASSM